MRLLRAYLGLFARLLGMRLVPRDKTSGWPARRRAGRPELTIVDDELQQG